MLLANTYHLLLRPGMDIFEKFGGVHLHELAAFGLTDSGGFQIFSFPGSPPLGEDGAEFRATSKSMVRLSPELSIADRGRSGPAS